MAGVTDQGHKAAGAFSAWTADVQAAIRGERAAEVPCDGCTACCTSSQFVHIGPDEADALAHIPAELLFAAPSLPAGHVVLGYDERGHCPMLVEGRCSIYEHRPRACRTYDCRVFPAADLAVDATDDGGGAGQAAIAHQAGRWRFSYPTDDDRSRHAAIRAAARFFRRGGDLPQDRAAPRSATRLAVLAVEAHDAFLQRDPATGRLGVIAPDPAEVRVALAGRRRTSSRPGAHDGDPSSAEC
jgi:hypothetical protein